MLSQKPHAFSYGKNEKLKSRKLISRIFEKGESVSAFPLRMVYIQIENPANAVNLIGVSVSKKHFKRAVDRNHHKRLLRECYRLNKNIIENHSGYAMMILYQSSESIGYAKIELQLKKLLEKFVAKVATKAD